MVGAYLRVWFGAAAVTGGTVFPPNLSRPISMKMAGVSMTSRTYVRACGSSRSSRVVVVTYLLDFKF